MIASFLSPTAFALGSINFADYERAHVGLRWSNMWRVCSFRSLSSFLVDFLHFTILFTYIMTTGIFRSVLFGLSPDDVT